MVDIQKSILGRRVGLDKDGNLVVGGGIVTNANGIAAANAVPGFTNWHPNTATAGTDTTPASGTQFVTSLFLPIGKLITGISYLIGSVGGTDKVYAVLYDAAGNVLANSTVASSGTTVGTAANQMALAFTATYQAASGLFYAGISINGATSRLRTVPAHTQGGIFANSVSQTHGTIAAISPPTTFTADKGPVVFVY